MKKLIICMLFMVNIISFHYAVAADDIAQEILKKADEILSGDKGIKYITEMKIYRKGELQNSYTMNNYLKGKDKMLISFLTPLRIKDQAILRNGSDQWIYFPKIKRALKISTRQQMVGSDFSYGDILNIDLEKEYEVKILNENIAEEGFLCYQLELTAKKPTSTYDKIIYYISKEDYCAIKREFYTKSGKRFKVLVFKDHDQQGVPRVWEMSSLLNPGYITLMLIDEIEKKDFSDLYFTLEYLHRNR